MDGSGFGGNQLSGNLTPGQISAIIANMLPQLAGPGQLTPPVGAPGAIAKVIVSHVDHTKPLAFSGGKTMSQDGVGPSRTANEKAIANYNKLGSSLRDYAFASSGGGGGSHP